MSFILFPSIVLLPLTTTIVRYRLAYHRKDSEDAKPTLFTTFKNVRSVEGWGALYKGMIPAALSLIVILPIFLGFQIPKWLIMPSPVTSTFHYFLPACFGNIFWTIGLTWIYRAVSTPLPLSVSQTSIKEAWDALFTSYERSGRLGVPFFSVLSTPGLGAAMFLSLVLRMLVLSPLLIWLKPDPRSFTHWTEYVLAAAPPSALLMLAMFILAPLDVVITRLVVQRNYQPSPLISQTSGTWAKLTKLQKIFVSGMGVVNLIALIVWHSMHTSRDRDDNKRAVVVQIAIVGIDCLFFIWLVLGVLRKVERVQETEVAGDVADQDVVFDADIQEDAIEGKKSSLPLPSPLPEPAVATTVPQAAIRYRPEDLPPYQGLYDCVQKVVEEEGWYALYRGWWITLIGAYMTHYN